MRVVSIGRSICDAIRSPFRETKGKVVSGAMVIGSVALCMFLIDKVRRHIKREEFYSRLEGLASVIRRARDLENEMYDEKEKIESNLGRLSLSDLRCKRLDFCSKCQKITDELTLLSRYFQGFKGESGAAVKMKIHHLRIRIQALHRSVHGHYSKFKEKI